MSEDEILELIANTLASSHASLPVRRNASSYELAFWRWHAGRVVEALHEAGVPVADTESIA